MFDEEPLSEDNPYIKLDNITLTPHLAGTSKNTLSNAVEIVAEDLKRYFNNEDMKCIVR